MKRVGGAEDLLVEQPVNPHLALFDRPVGSSGQDLIDLKTKTRSRTKTTIRSMNSTRIRIRIKIRIRFRSVNSTRIRIRIGIGTIKNDKIRTRTKNCFKVMARS